MSFSDADRSPAPNGVTINQGDRILYYWPIDGQLIVVSEARAGMTKESIRVECDEAIGMRLGGLFNGRLPLRVNQP